MSTPRPRHFEEEGAIPAGFSATPSPGLSDNQTDQMRMVLAEVTAMRNENAWLKRTVMELKAGSKTRKKLFKQDVEPECSVGVCDCWRSVENLFHRYLRPRNENTL